MQHPKSVLIEHCKQAGLAKPKFDTKNTGPEPEPTFVSDVLIQGEVYGKGEGNNKREAERKASEAATLEAEKWVCKRGELRLCAEPCRVKPRYVKPK